MEQKNKVIDITGTELIRRRFSYAGNTDELTDRFDLR